MHRAKTHRNRRGTLSSKSGRMRGRCSRAREFAEEALHPLPVSVRVVAVLRLTSFELELDQQFEICPGEHAPLLAARSRKWRRRAARSIGCRRIRQDVRSRDRRERDTIGVRAAAFPLGPSKRVAPQEPRDGKGQVGIARRETRANRRYSRRARPGCCATSSVGRAG